MAHTVEGVVRCDSSNASSSYQGDPTDQGLLQTRSQINIASWPIDVRAPVMSIERILLIKIDFEELVVAAAFEVLEAAVC